MFGTEDEKQPNQKHFTGRVMKGWLYVTGPSTKKVAGLGTWIARGETALRAPTRKPGGGTR